MTFTPKELAYSIASIASEVYPFPFIMNFNGRILTLGEAPIYFESCEAIIPATAVPCDSSSVKS